MAGDTAATFAGVDYESVVLTGLVGKMGVTNDGDVCLAEQVVRNLGAVVSEDERSVGEFKGDGASSD